MLYKEVSLRGTGPDWGDIAEAMKTEDVEVVVDEIVRQPSKTPIYQGLPETMIQGHFSRRGTAGGGASLWMLGYDTTGMRLGVGDVLLVRLESVMMQGAPGSEMTFSGVMTMRTPDGHLAMAYGWNITEPKYSRDLPWPSPLLPELEAAPSALACNFSIGHFHGIAPLSVRSGGSSAEILQGSSAIVGDLDVGVDQSIREETVGAGLPSYGREWVFAFQAVSQSFLGLARDQ